LSRVGSGFAWLAFEVVFLEGVRYQKGKEKLNLLPEPSRAILSSHGSNNQIYL
jgi:hypothetical protein